MMMIAVFLAVAAAAPQFLDEQRKPVIITKQAQEHDTEQQKYSYRSASTILIPFIFNTIPVIIA